MTNLSPGFRWTSCLQFWTRFSLVLFLDSEQGERPEQDINLEQLKRTQETLQNNLDALSEQSKNHLFRNHYNFNRNSYK